MMVHMDPEWINYKLFEKVNNNLEPLKTLRNKNSTFLMAFYVIAANRKVAFFWKIHYSDEETKNITGEE